MSIQTVPVLELPRFPDSISTAPSIAGANTFDITGLNGNVSYICQMPYTGFIDSLFFRLFTVSYNTGVSSVVLKAEIENVNISQGVPTGTLLNPNASATIAIINSTNPANYEVRFPQPFEIIKGQHFAINISLFSGTVSGNGIRFAYFEDDKNTGNGFPYVLDESAPPTAAGIRANIAPCFGIGLSAVSATPLPFCWPINNTPPTLTFGSPTKHGNKITINSPVRACGATVWGQVATVSSVIILYDTDGTSVLTQQAWQHNLPNNTTIYKFNITFDQPVNLNAGTYYIAVSGGGTNNTTMYYASFNSSFWRMASPMGGTDVCYVSSNIAGDGNPSWTTVDTRQAFIGLLIDGIDDGAQTGGGGETSCVFAA
jgi:hypothetical protein